MSDDEFNEWINDEVQTLKTRVHNLETLLVAHANTAFVKAHTRSGSLEEVMQYLGFPKEESDRILALLEKEIHPEAKDVAPEAVV